MQIRHLAIVLVVVAIWGINFVFIRYGLDGFPPFLLSACRFLLAAVPAVFLLPRPRCSTRLLVAYGLVIFALQFGFLFSGMRVGMSAGLASLLMQLQAFFTMGLSAWLLKDRPSLWKIVGALVSFVGIVVVARHTEGELTPAGLALTLMASFSWSCGSIIAKKIGPVNPLALVVWGSLIAFPALMAASLLFEGPERIATAISHVSLKTGIALFYIAYGSTHVAYSLWGYLLNRYPASTVAPYGVLVPIFGFLGAVLALGEQLPSWKLWAALIVMTGLVINGVGDRWAARRG